MEMDPLTFSAIPLFFCAVGVYLLLSGIMNLVSADSLRNLEIAADGTELLRRSMSNGKVTHTPDKPGSGIRVKDMGMIRRRIDPIFTYERSKECRQIVENQLFVAENKCHSLCSALRLKNNERNPQTVKTMRSLIASGKADTVNECRYAVQYNQLVESSKRMQNFYADWVADLRWKNARLSDQTQRAYREADYERARANQATQK